MRTWRYFGFVSTLIALFAVGLVFAARSQTREKAPRVVLQISSTPPQLPFGEDGEHRADSEFDYRRYQTTQIALLKSRLVILSALQKRQVAKLPSIAKRQDPASWLKDHLNASFLPDSEVLEISMAPGTGMNRQEQATLLGAITDAYMEEVVNVDRQRRAQRYDILNDLFANKAKMIDAKRERLRKLAGSSNPTAPFVTLLKETAPRLYEAIWLQQIKLRLERADCESQLAGWKKAGGTASDQDHKEIGQLEEHHASLIAQDKILTDELANMEKQLHASEDGLTEAARIQAEINASEEQCRELGREIQKLEIELMAPGRVKKIEDAEP